ncbi:MAG: hypothetical protein HY646_01370 [Acidobacteria bacterium]|nr:hypothetical protein [Acidobacteriota bacterium]
MADLLASLKPASVLGRRLVPGANLELEIVDIHTVDAEIAALLANGGRFE